ncbi:MAG: MYG1 family protein [Promethearchaeota archaeon]
MATIITHPGSAHLDDFLSSCLVIYKSGDIEKIYRKEPDISEIEDPNIWKLDVGDKFDPAIKCYDHHNVTIEDCTLSLLLKDWGIWEKANIVHNWLKVAVVKDAKGPKEVLNLLNISYTALNGLDSFIERTILGIFEKKDVINRKSALFSLMKTIGKRFFTQIDEYFKVLKLVEANAEYKKIKGVPIVMYYENARHSSMLVRILNEKKKEFFGDERGGIVIFPNNRPEGTIGLKKYDNDRRVDFSKIAKYEKVVYTHPQGFFLVVDKMSPYELERYIEDAIIGKSEEEIF